MISRDHHRQERAHAVGADHRGVLDLGRARQAARVGINCSLGADGDAPVPRRARGARADPRQLLPERRPAQRLRRLRRDRPSRPRRCCASSPRAASLNIVGGCCGTTPEHIRAIARGGGATFAPRAPAAPELHVRRVSGLEALTIRPDVQLPHDRRAHQRHRLANASPS